ncbi:MAG: Gfo/Idh/MocA family protein [Thermoguttaceae bacterium]
MIYSNRRSFLQSAGAIGLAVMTLKHTPHVHAAESNEIRFALIGAGGRGRGAVINALSVPGPSKLVAIADIFDDRVQSSAKAISSHYESTPERLDIPHEKQFSGFDAYKKAIDVLRPGDIAILASCAVFRPIHVEYAVEKGVHVFMEKPFATDSPGTRRIQAAAKKADEKNLKIACGLMWRHCKARQEVVARIHGGEIGELIHLRGYRMHNPSRASDWKEGQNEVTYQIRNFHFFDWSGGDMFIDYCIHNIDVACWAKNAWPVSAIGMGGRNNPELQGQTNDNYYQEFTFADGSILSSHGRYQNGCFNRYSDIAHGTKGSAVLMESLGKAQTRLFPNHTMAKGTESWAFSDAEPNPYQIEWNEFIAAIREDRHYNEGHRAAEANFASLLGRAAMNSGLIVTWDDIVNSNLSLCPNIDTLTFDSEPPIKPNEIGKYPCAMPGITKAF